MKNSCGKRRGCSVTIILPNDGRTINVSSRMLPKQNDTKEVLLIPKLPLHKELEKAA